MLRFLQQQLVGRGIALLEENKGVITMAENQISGRRTNNVDVRHNFIREVVEHNVNAIQNTESAGKHDDILM